jgi:hypothetical protein
MESKSFETMVEDMKNPSVLEAIGKKMSLIKQGDWDSLISLAKEERYNFELSDVISYFKNHTDILSKASQDQFLKAWIAPLGIMNK